MRLAAAVPRFPPASDEGGAILTFSPREKVAGTAG